MNNMANNNPDNRIPPIVTPAAIVSICLALIAALNIWWTPTKPKAAAESNQTSVTKVTKYETSKPETAKQEKASEAVAVSESENSAKTNESKAANNSINHETPKESKPQTENQTSQPNQQESQGGHQDDVASEKPADEDHKENFANQRIDQ